MSAVVGTDECKLTTIVEDVSLLHTGLDFAETVSGTIECHELLCGPHISWQRMCHASRAVLA